MNQVNRVSPFFLTDTQSGQVIYLGRPSQIVNAGFFFGTALKIAACVWLYLVLKEHWDLNYWFVLVPVLFFIWTLIRRTVETHFIQFRIDPDRITWKTGVFATTTATVEIFRIQNITMNQGFIERFFNVGALFIETIDPGHAWINMYGVRHPEQLRLFLTQYVPIHRGERGFREFSTY